MFNRSSFKFMLGFMGILLAGLIAFYITAEYYEAVDSSAESAILPP